MKRSSSWEVIGNHFVFLELDKTTVCIVMFNLPFLRVLDVNRYTSAAAENVIQLFFPSVIPVGGAVLSLLNGFSFKISASLKLA